MSAAVIDLRTPAASKFHIGLAAACVVVAFGAFTPTYWLQLPAGTFVGPPLLHLHGALFSAWTLLLVSQAWLASTGRLRNHRAWGLAGISLATAMVFVGIAAAIDTMLKGLAGGYGDASRAFLLLPVSAIGLFAGYFIAALANVRRPDWHQRLMLLASFALLQAAMARVFFILMTGGGPGLRPGLGAPPPLAIGLVPSFIVELLIVAGIVYDWRTRGRPHPAWLIGIVVTTTVVAARGPLSGTHVWLACANALAHIMG